MLASSALVRERLYQLRPRVRIGPTFGYLCQNSSVPGGSAEKNKDSDLPQKDKQNKGHTNKHFSFLL